MTNARQGPPDPFNDRRDFGAMSLLRQIAEEVGSPVKPPGTSDRSKQVGSGPRYGAIVKVKSPSVTWVSTERTRQTTL